jgi:hypothetical protein
MSAALADSLMRRCSLCCFRSLLNRVAPLLRNSDNMEPTTGSRSRQERLEHQYIPTHRQGVILSRKEALLVVPLHLISCGDRTKVDPSSTGDIEPTERQRFDVPGQAR